MQATPYIPHQEQTYPLSLGNIELCKIGDYQDTIYGKPDNWFLKKKIGKGEINGTENWMNYNDSPEKYYCTTKHFGKNPGYESISNFKCSHFKPAESTAIVNSISITKYATYINISATIVKDVTAFKNYLVQQYANGTPVIVQYKLEDEAIEPITDPTLVQQLNDLYYAKSYQGISYITVDTENLKPILKVDYKKSNLLRIKALENA